MKAGIERRISDLETKATPPKRRIETFLDLVVWSNEEPRDHDVEFAPWVEELAAKVASR